MANSLEFSTCGDPIEHRFDDYGSDIKEYRDIAAEHYSDWIEQVSAEPDLLDMIEVTEALLGCSL